MTRRMRKKLQQRLLAAALCGDPLRAATALRSGAVAAPMITTISPFGGPS